jgi:hypothetical protein
MRYWQSGSLPVARELTNWLESYIQYTDASESPISYHTWCGLSVIAGALQRRIYLKWGLGQVIYPNLYVVLIGPSGRTRKGVALGIAKDILRQISGISIAPESSSGRQAMILAMKRSLLNFQDPSTGTVKLHCAITAFSEELSVFLGQGDIAYLSNLTDWYDSKDDWEYETVGRGKDTLQGLCLNLMGGTAPDWIQSMIPPEAVGGGFTSRVIFIVESEKRKTVPKYEMSEADHALQRKLINDLERISKLSGEVTFTPAAEELYVNWYVEQDTLLAGGKPAIDDTRFAGYCERRATHIRKLMLICSASRGDDLVIRSEDFHMALDLLTSAEKNMHKTFGGLGRAKNSDVTEQIKDYIQKIGTTTRKLIMQRFYRDLLPEDLTRIEQTLQHMKVISVEISSNTQDKIYRWIGDAN